MRSVAPTRCALRYTLPYAFTKQCGQLNFNERQQRYLLITSLMYMLSTSAAVRLLRREGNRRPILQSTKPVGARAVNHAEIAVQIVAAASLSGVFGQGGFHSHLDNTTGAPGAGTQAGAGGTLAPQRCIVSVSSPVAAVSRCGTTIVLSDASDEGAASAKLCPAHVALHT